MQRLFPSSLEYIVRTSVSVVLLISRYCALRSIACAYILAEAGLVWRVSVTIAANARPCVTAFLARERSSLRDGLFTSHCFVRRKESFECFFFYFCFFLAELQSHGL